ncbi:hypothetical protein [Pandoraea sp. PE-S2R-1]|uniref:hypothetical protein n=1 Tax=Pandoraea sp. PE-S2R-1 TaxID=1986994 RepID=UPI000B3FD79C|nr:hypothetical protein [Pandoraea sp. PE-S2R-1]
MTHYECWRRFDVAVTAALRGNSAPAWAFVKEVEQRFGEEVGARQEKELRAFIAMKREKGK